MEKLQLSLKVENVTPILNVRSVPESLAWFERLGWIRTFTWNEAGAIIDASDRDEDGEADYGGVASGSVQTFLCLDEQGARGNSREVDPFNQCVGVWMTWWLGSHFTLVVEACYSQRV